MKEIQNVCKLFPFIPILLLSFSYGGAPVALRYLWLVNNQKKREKNDFKQNLILKSQSSAKSVKCRANWSKLLTSSAILSINWSQLSVNSSKLLINLPGLRIPSSCRRTHPTCSDSCQSSLLPIYTLGWREALRESSFFSRTQQKDPESRALIAIPLRLPESILSATQILSV